ncbi:MAG: hypothetical protein FJ146_12215 [Deltaproteobacteria bacterium]|nr:hypothetical protein [Deltaproteobacteria bacterium]
MKPTQILALACVISAVFGGTAMAKPGRRPANDGGGSGAGGVSGFSLDRLPPGKNVTRPRPATTYVRLSSRVVLTGTDMPQTLRFMPINLASGSVRSLRLAIFDKNSERVQYVRVSPDTPFLYPIKDLSPITVIAEAIAGGSEGLQLQVESDKPLDVAH